MSQSLMRFDEVLARLSGEHDGPGEEPDPMVADGAEPVYRNVDEWVRDVFVLLLGDLKIRTEVGRGDGLNWCPRWWGHPLALDRMESLWRAWEVLRLDPGTGMSVWYRDHFAPALADLTGDDGPFRRCDKNRHSDAIPAAPAVPAPDAVLSRFADKAPPA
ncbi:hypothetical protein AMIS_12830 [Actinoplanes missouriensis 431]|uniref:DUF4913 domain-containing protein n=1 Tax=Actinoplanes missouriensis (strain ATCC 14538 / DSM 43046 / CBS 188.64 / JCM 3121 / NBRC 102363 / NCIMB 12654 / NRRL B-3342 / UNCC 431) TaxID=512565 RepID=I0H0G6_ACTM4|nr:DUF4913 domain-containing protein [Actinoplanes missouriensis]BAL86503.1 hypothetical protein AMIS_12830 [Actinoplanes missouriensis 431]